MRLQSDKGELDIAAVPESTSVYIAIPIKG